MLKHKTTHQVAVERFMEKAGQAVPARPTVLDEETREFRAKLIWEEAVRELLGLGLGVSVKVKGKDITSKDFEVEIVADKDFDMVEMVDGCADAAVVITGTASQAGVNMSPVQMHVDARNMEKFGPGSYESDGSDGNPAGKWIKPPNFVPANIAARLLEQGWAGDAAPAPVATPSASSGDLTVEGLTAGQPAAGEPAGQPDPELLAEQAGEAPDNPPPAKKAKAPRDGKESDASAASVAAGLDLGVGAGD